MKVKPVKKHDTSNKDYYSRLQSLLGPSSTKLKEKSHFSVSGIYSNDNFYEIINSKIKLSEVVLTKPLKSVIDQLVNEYKNSDLLNEYGIQNDNSILFHGPSGCGKTLTALALAQSLGKKLYLVNLSTIISSSLGKTSSRIFELVEDAKKEGAIVFFDEFDALAKKRNDENDHGEIKRVTSALLQVMDFLDSDTILIAATNHIELIDKAILRRFKKKVAFELPDKRYLKVYLNRLLKALKIKSEKNVMSALVERYSSLSYAEVRDAFLSDMKSYLLKKHKSSTGRLTSIGPDFLK